MSTYVEVARRYWPFLPSAFLAHRAAFLRKPLSLGRDMSLMSLASSNKLGDLFRAVQKCPENARVDFLLFLRPLREAGKFRGLLRRSVLTIT